MQGFRDRGATPRLSGAGGGTVSDSILGGHKTLFLTKSFLKILGGGTFPPAPFPCCAVTGFDFEKIIMRCQSELLICTVMNIKREVFLKLFI